MITGVAGFTAFVMMGMDGQLPRKGMWLCPGRWLPGMVKTWDSGAMTLADAVDSVLNQRESKNKELERREREEEIEKKRKEYHEVPIEKKLKEYYEVPVDSGVKNRPIRFKLTARTDDLQILRTTLQIHWSSPIVNKRNVLTFSKDRDIADGTL